jgi:hypothetical protein
MAGPNWEKSKHYFIDRDGMEESNEKTTSGVRTVFLIPLKKVNFVDVVYTSNALIST